MKLFFAGSDQPRIFSIRTQRIKSTKRMMFLATHLLALTTSLLPLNGCNANGDLGGEPKKVYKVANSKKLELDSNNNEIFGTRRNAITKAVAKASPAVVGINVTEVREEKYYDPFENFFNDPFLERFFGQRSTPRTYKYQVKGLGSGFIISPDGYILTNDHVAGNATKIIVTTTSGAQYDAELIATDRTTDVALLKIKGNNLPYVAFGNSDDLAVGEWAIAMGNPFGLFEINDKPTVTVGVVSNTQVNLGLEEGRNYRGMIQTDAAISSGNSGGPLLNANGDVIGINAVIRSTAQSYQGAGSIGLGFAIPINKVRTIIDEFLAGRKIERPTANLGFRVSPLTDDLKQYFNITGDDGIVVTDIGRSSPADQAGLEPGDLITKVDSDRVRNADELMSILADRRAGDVVKLEVLRGSKSLTVKLPLNQQRVTGR